MLKIETLHLSFGHTRILNGVTLNVSAGERVGIIGPNGSGKTTLFNCLSGFHRPSSGQIYFRGENITHHSSAQRARLGIGRLFQNYGIFREMTVLENMLVAIEAVQGGSFAPWTAHAQRTKQRALEYLDSVHLADRAAEKAASLSGGQLRLLEIVRLLAFESKLFLLDEPTAGVSPKMKDEIESALSSVCSVGDVTVLIIEHDITFIQRLCERIVVLDVGQVVLDGSPDYVRADPRLQEIYFGSQAQPELAAVRA